MDVLIFLMGFLIAAAAGWAALKADYGAVLSALAYGSTFLVVIGVGLWVRRRRD